MIKGISVPNPPIELQKEFELRYLKLIETKEKLKSSIILLKNLVLSISQLAFIGELRYGHGIALEILLDNDYAFFRNHSDTKTVQQLLTRLDKDGLNENKFYVSDIYDKAKRFVFELLKEDKLEQFFDTQTDMVKLKLK